MNPTLAILPPRQPPHPIAPVPHRFPHARAPATTLTRARPTCSSVAANSKAPLSSRAVGPCGAWSLCRVCVCRAKHARLSRVRSGLAYLGALFLLFVSGIMLLCIGGKRAGGLIAMGIGLYAFGL